MSIQSGIPKGAAVAINDLLENCAKIQPGHEVVLLAHIDGLYGGFYCSDSCYMMGPGGKF